MALNPNYDIRMSTLQRTGQVRSIAPRPPPKPYKQPEDYEQESTYESIIHTPEPYLERRDISKESCYTLQNREYGKFNTQRCTISRPQFHQDDRTSTDQNLQHIVNQSDIVFPEKSINGWKAQVKKVGIALFVITFMILLAAALALGVSNLVMKNTAQSSAIQPGAQVSNNETLFSSARVKQLTSQVQNLELLLSQFQRRLEEQDDAFAEQLNNISSAATLYLSTEINRINAQTADILADVEALSTRVGNIFNASHLASDFTSLNSRVSALNSQLTSTSASLNSRVSSINSQLTSTSSSLTSLTSRMNSINSQLTSTTSSLNSLRSSVRRPVNLYRGCYQDTATCSVVRHSTNRYWYVCSTPWRRANATGYYTLSTRCIRDPDSSYIDISELQISGSWVKCVCSVVGLTSGGNHGSSFVPLPTGDCHLIITRCPTSQAIF